MTPLLAARNASFGYRGRPVLTGVELEVRPGDAIGIVGPNGAGKTTLFRGMLGLIPAMSGKVERGDVRVGYVPQREALDPVYPLTAFEVVCMGAFGRLSGLRRLSRAERELADSCLDRVGLLGRRGEPFASLSGGQRQRALIARALAMQPNVLFLDEPTSGVDRRAQETIHDLLVELRRDKIAVLLVSHALASLGDVTDDALVVAEGQVERGSCEELLAPANLDRLFGAAKA